MMKQLIVVRHGECGQDNRLNYRGYAQMVALAGKLKPFINGESVLIITSPTDRTRESARILGTAFGSEIEEYEVLWSENSHPEDFPGALELVRSQRDKADVLILVTHYEYTEGFPEFFAKEELEVKLHAREIKKGEALVIDCLQNTLTHIV